MVVYFSGTGNSKFCAKALACGLQDDLLDAGHYIRHQIAADLISGKDWVFVSPTYAWRLPRIFEAFIRSGSFMGSTNAYFVMTCGDDIGNAGQYIEALCEEKGLNFRGVYPVVMPENYIAMFEVPTKDEAEAIIAQAQPVLATVASLILSGEAFPCRHIHAKDKLKSGSVHDIFYKNFVKARDFYTTDGCVSCGKCAERCVMGNISLENGKPVWGDVCTHCMACICGCPVEAVEYGKKSIGKTRYWCREYTP